jgi:hypothetical protein
LIADALNIRSEKTTKDKIQALIKVAIKTISSHKFYFLNLLGFTIPYPINLIYTHIIEKRSLLFHEISAMENGAKEGLKKSSYFKSLFFKSFEERRLNGKLDSTTIEKDQKINGILRHQIRNENPRYSKIPLEEMDNQSVKSLGLFSIKSRISYRQNQSKSLARIPAEVTGENIEHLTKLYDEDPSRKNSAVSGSENEVPGLLMYLEKTNNKLKEAVRPEYEQDGDFHIKRNGNIKKIDIKTFGRAGYNNLTPDQKKDILIRKSLSKLPQNVEAVVDTSHSDGDPQILEDFQRSVKNDSRFSDVSFVDQRKSQIMKEIYQTAHQHMKELGENPLEKTIDDMEKHDLTTLKEIYTHVMLNPSDISPSHINHQAAVSMSLERQHQENISKITDENSSKDIVIDID